MTQNNSYILQFPPSPMKPNSKLLRFASRGRYRYIFFFEIAEYFLKTRNYRPPTKKNENSFCGAASSTLTHNIP